MWPASMARESTRSSTEQNATWDCKTSPFQEQKQLSTKEGVNQLLLLLLLFLFTVQPVYVMPSTSGRAATYPKRSDKLKFFHELKALRDRLCQEREGAVAAAPPTIGEGEEESSVSNGNGKSSVSVTTDSS